MILNKNKRFLNKLTLSISEVVARSSSWLSGGGERNKPTWSVAPTDLTSRIQASQDKFFIVLAGLDPGKTELGGYCRKNGCSPAVGGVFLADQA